MPTDVFCPTVVKTGLINQFVKDVLDTSKVCNAFICLVAFSHLCPSDGGQGMRIHPIRHLPRSQSKSLTHPYSLLHRLIHPSLAGGQGLWASSGPCHRRDLLPCIRNVQDFEDRPQDLHLGLHAGTQRHRGVCRHPMG